MGMHTSLWYGGFNSSQKVPKRGIAQSNEICSLSGFCIDFSTFINMKLLNLCKNVITISKSDT